MDALTDRLDGTAEVKLLLVEDDELDVMAIKRALRKAKVANELVVAKDGVEGLAILRGEGATPLHQPYLILLDLNMPRMNGIEFLTELREDPLLRDSIVFVLTTSDSDSDIVRAYDKFIAGYIVKSKAGDDFMELIGMLDHYWKIIEFPLSKSGTVAGRSNQGHINRHGVNDGE